AIENRDLNTGRSLQPVLVVVGIAAVYFELRTELVIHATGVVCKEGPGRGIVSEIAHRAGAAERSGKVGCPSNVVRKNLSRDGVKAAQWDHGPSCRWRPSAWSRDRKAFAPFRRT